MTSRWTTWTLTLRCGPTWRPTFLSWCHWLAAEVASTSEATNERVTGLVGQIATEQHSYGVALDRSAAFREMSALDPAGRRAGVLAVLAWLNGQTGPDPNGHVWQVRA